VVGGFNFYPRLITMEVDAAEGVTGNGDGTSARQARLAGAWNKHDDAAVAGILAAARAAGATGASVRYGEVVTKVWFESKDSEQTEVDERFRELQLATAQQRLQELERRTTSTTRRAQKEKERKKRQKAAKQAGRAELARRAQQRDAAQAATQAKQPEQQRNSQPAEQRPAEQPMQVEAVTGRKEKEKKGPQAAAGAVAGAAPAMGLFGSTSSTSPFRQPSPSPAPVFGATVGPHAPSFSQLFGKAAGPKPGWGG
jgi:hypothetical protein